MTDSIIVRQAGDWTEITLNRPERLNALTPEMLAALRTGLNDAIAAGTRAILLTGAGRGFCSGQDLGRRDPDGPDWPPDLAASLRDNYHPVIRLIRGAPLPVIAAVNGPAAGAGANLALACDLVLAAQSATFIQAFSRVGLVPDAGGAWVLPRLVGEARAKQLIMTGEALSAQAAADWGMIWKCLPDEELMEKARALAGKMAGAPTKALGLGKQLIEAAWDSDLETFLGREAEAQAACAESADYAEGVRAFSQKRPPHFQGR